jgi:Delta7-sterol 5-desaturase
MRDFILSSNAIEIMLSGLVFFFCMYFLFCLFNIALSSWVFPAFKKGKVLDARTVNKKQLQREIGLSLITVSIFGLGVIFPWGLLQLGWAYLAENPSWLQISIEIVVLFFWNELHFYINHRLLHTPWLRRFHKAHHQSMTTTPWTTYSFHPVESMMLGGVLILPMLVHDFSVEALFSVPVFSFVINQIGHANYDWFPESRFFLFHGARRHQQHHEKIHGNFGFALGWFDRWLKTGLPSASSDNVDGKQ